MKKLLLLIPFVLLLGCDRRTEKIYTLSITSNNDSVPADTIKLLGIGRNVFAIREGNMIVTGDFAGTRVVQNNVKEFKVISISPVKSSTVKKQTKKISDIQNLY